MADVVKQIDILNQIGRNAERQKFKSTVYSDGNLRRISLNRAFLLNVYVQYPTD